MIIKHKKAQKLALKVLAATTIISVLPITYLIASRASQKEEFDFGITIPKINSLNYVKYSLATIQASTALIDGLYRLGPTGDLKNYLQLPTLNAEVWTAPSETDPAMHNGRSYPLSNNGIFAAGITDGDDSHSFVLIQNKNNNISDIFFKLNPRIVWKSGDPKWDKKNARPVVASDYVDYIRMIADLNVSSQNSIRIQEMGLKGFDEFVEAQVLYYQKNNEIYATPFDGKLKKDGTVSETKSENKELFLGINSGNDLKNIKLGIPSASNAFDVISRMADANEKLVKGWENNFLHFQYRIPKSFSSAFTDMKNVLKPINKKFIEDHGGIDNFGSSIETFAWNGPFDLEAMILGDQGSLVLKRNEDHFRAHKTLVKRIKIYFQDDDVVKGALFDDGKIAYTRVPAIYQMRFWSDPHKRRYMKKVDGFGTIGLGLNLDPKSNPSSVLHDEDLRRALSYAIDRAKILRFAGWNSSFPVTHWTAFGQVKDSKGRAIETYWKDALIQSANDKSFPVINTSWEDHKVKINSFESSQRFDRSFDLETARYYMNIYKAKNPDQKEIVIEFLDNGDQAARQVYIGLENMFSRAFGGYLKLEQKTLPPNVYLSYVDNGKFDIIYKNYDAYGSEIHSYIKRFLLPDEIDLDNNKTIGFKENPSGSYTYTRYREQKRKEGAWKSLRSLLNIDLKSWKILNLLIPEKEKLTKQNQASISHDFVNYFIGQGIKGHSEYDNSTDFEIAMVVLAFEKIIKHSVPVLPLMEVDVFWSISRLNGLTLLQELDLQFAYDVDKKPREDLPGIEKE